MNRNFSDMDFIKRELALISMILIINFLAIIAFNFPYMEEIFKRIIISILIIFDGIILFSYSTVIDNIDKKYNKHEAKKKIKTYWEKKADSYKSANYIFLSIIIFLILAYLFNSIYIAYNIKTGKSDICENNYVKMIDKINNDCGSTFITKRYGENRYSVYLEINNDGWKRFEYVPLENCLK